MANLYTKTGDGGQTSLYGGSRVSKSSLRVDCYGTIDETNSMLGVAYSLSENKIVKEEINRIQKRLFSVGAELASDRRGAEMLQGKVTEEDIHILEKLVDDCTKVNGKQSAFVVPGVNPPSAALHVARTVVRRGERKIITLGEQDDVRPVLIRYVNRLSDAIYALARLEETCAQIGQAVKRELGEACGADAAGEMAEMVGKPFTLATIKDMAAAAEEKAQEMGVPIVFAAVDQGGRLILLHRMEGSLLGSIDISQNKAYTALALKMPTNRLADSAAPGGELYGIQQTNEGKIVIFGGGYPYSFNGQVAGAIGVSGGTVEEDMAIASFALRRARAEVK